MIREYSHSFQHDQWICVLFHYFYEQVIFQTAWETPQSFHDSMDQDLDKVIGDTLTLGYGPGSKKLLIHKAVLHMKQAPSLNDTR